MKWTKFDILLIILCEINQSFASKNSSALSQDTLQSQYGVIEYAALIFRHGDRTPVSLYPTDPYKNYAWPVDLGQLRNEGKRREFSLGKYFEPRYNCITGTPYLPTRVIMQSSDLDRCLMSGALFYAGYYPPTGQEIWNENLLWQPIPVHTTPPANDYVIANSKPCPRLDEVVNNFYTTNPIVKSICDTYRNLFVYAEKYSGLNMTPCESEQSVWNLIALQDTLLVETQLNLTLPEWTRAVFPQPLTYLRGVLSNIEVKDPVVQKFMAGPLLNVIASDMLNIARLNNTLPQILYTSNSSQTRPLHLFSGHDTTIVTLMRALNTYSNISVPYGAALGVELRTRDNTQYVTVVYENSTNEPPHLLDVPGCGGSCTLSNFISLIKPLIPQNWEAECQNISKGNTTLAPPTTLPDNTSEGTSTTTPMPTTTTTTNETGEPTTWRPPSITPQPPPGWIPPTK